MTTETTDHARGNASSWMDTVNEYARALNPETWERLEELRSQVEDARDSVDSLDESALSSVALDAGENAEYTELLALEEEYRDEDHAREMAEESALSVEVRSDWHNPGEDADPGEFMILLSTGGPALRIVGDLDKGSPSNPRLEYQDWGTPWTEYGGDNFDPDALETFCGVFYFGE